MGGHKARPAQKSSIFPPDPGRSATLSYILYFFSINVPHM